MRESVFNIRNLAAFRVELMSFTQKLVLGIVAAALFPTGVAAQDWTPAYHLYNPSGWMVRELQQTHAKFAVAGLLWTPLRISRHFSVLARHVVVSVHFFIIQPV